MLVLALVACPCLLLVPLGSPLCFLLLLLLLCSHLLFLALVPGRLSLLGLLAVAVLWLFGCGLLLPLAPPGAVPLLWLPWPPSLRALLSVLVAGHRLGFFFVGLVLFSPLLSLLFGICHLALLVLSGCLLLPVLVFVCLVALPFLPGRILLFSRTFRVVRAGVCACWLVRSSLGGAVSALVGFSGSRSLPASFGGLVSSLVASVLSSGRGVAVGCAPGLDALVRAACPEAEVYRVDGSNPGAFAARSVACVRAVAASGSGAGWVSVPGAECPAGLLPCASPFRGLGSGSWASAALAAHLGLPVLVFGLPAHCLPRAWGSWVAASASGPWASGYLLVPAVRQLALF